MWINLNRNGTGRAARRAAFAACVASILAAGLASAADLPVKAWPPAAVVPQHGWYVGLDGSYQELPLPYYALGIRATNLVAFSDIGSMQAFSPKADGFGIRGVVGYVLPHGTFSPVFGSRARVELGVSFVDATASQLGLATTANNAVNQMYLNGSVSPFGFNCGGGNVCPLRSILSTDYRSWLINGRLASDYQVGAVTLTPSLAVFGGSTRNNQSLTQAMQFVAVGGVVTDAAAYIASTSLDWDDIGGRVGLDIGVDVTSIVATRLGGHVGFARRHASLSGTDQSTSALPAFIPPRATSVNASANVTPLLANLEAALILKLRPNISARGFAGLNYDSKVPGISSPSFTGIFGLPTSTTPAGIYFANETSWYAGGGIAAKFNP